LSASNLESMTLEQMRDLFTRHHATGRVPPNLEERCRLWNEVGRVLRTRLDGSVSTLIASAQGSAPALVQLLVDNFEGFQDRHSLGAASASATTTSSTVLHFYKRAQICVGDWNEAMKLNLKDMDQVTTFADYRVPQLLRHHGVLVYSAPLAALVDGGVELDKGCDEELAIRACTVTAVELLVQELKVNTSSSIANNDTTNAQMKWNAVATDWYLWQVGERMQNDGELQPHHRVRTIYY
jgi:Potential Queuosine, Q, salvage protein family